MDKRNLKSIRVAFEEDPKTDAYVHKTVGHQKISQWRREATKAKMEQELSAKKKRS